MEKNIEKYEYVIVGGGPASRILNHYLHMFNPDVSIAVIRNEDRIANHCSIPYIIDNTVALDKGGLTSDEIVTKFGSTLIKENAVSGDAEKKRLTTDAGRSIQYEKLIFATGSEETIPRISGIDLPGILKLHNIEDLRSALAVIHEKQKFVVLGGGYVGLEIASALARLKKDVTLVEMLRHVMGNRYDAEFVSRIENALKENNIRLELGKSAVRIGNSDHLEFLELADGSRLDVEAVVLATGVRPRIEYAGKFGLETTRDGIVVDEFFQTNIPDIYALGDCVKTHSYVTGEPFPGKLGSNAAQMARTLALNFNGRQIPFKGVISPSCTKIFNVQFCTAGHTEKDAQDQGIAARSIKTENTDIYRNMPHSKPVWVKLVFREKDRRLIGGEFIGEMNLAGCADCLGELIYRGATVEDVVTMAISTHPELTPDPAHSYLMFAAQKALQQWKDLP